MAKHNRDDDVQSSSSSGMKRQRVALACNPCRTRKSRCNGARPKCSLCERMSFDCTYDAPGSAANVIIPKDAFTDIESRLHLLEQLVKRHNEQLSVRSLSSVASEKGISDGDVESPPAGGLFGHQDADHELDDHTDGMAISFVDEKDQGFFGPSANISFMRIILRSMLAASTTGNGGGSGGGGGGSSSNSINVKPLPLRSTPAASARIASNTTGVLLPPEDVTEHLLQEYFSNTGMLFPYIHEASFLETYRQARLSGFAGVRRTWLALLNIILAMATRANAAQTNTHSRATDDADTFYRRAKKLCKTQMLHGLTLETVQYLLLSTQYLQGTQHAVQTWTTHGLAVKTALSIGLHSKVASAKFPVVEREMRKRTWYGCIVLDRSLSMTFGRPSAIPEDYVRLDLPMPIAGDREGGLSASFFSATVTLYRILWKIIASVYGHNIEHEDISTPDLMTRILQLEQDLDDWRSSLPPALRITSSIETSSPSAWSPSTARTPAQQVEKLRNIITLRYLNTKLLVLRPVLTNMLHTRFLSGAEAGNGYEVQHQQSEYFTSACFRAAVESIALIHAVVTRPDLGRHMLGAWWFTLCYAFNASLTVFGVLLMQPPPAQEDSEGKIDFSSPASYHSSNIQQGTRQGREALTKAIEALGALASDNALVDRCVEHLRQLMQVLDKRESSKPPMPAATSMTFPMDTSFVMGGMPTPTANGATGDFSESLNQGLVMSDTSMLGVGFPDYHTLLFDDEVGPGLFFSDSNNLDGGVAGAGQAQASWLDFGYQL